MTLAPMTDTVTEGPRVECAQHGAAGQRGDSRPGQDRAGRSGRRDGGGEATGGFGSSPGERVRAHQHVSDGKESVTMKTLAKSRHHIKSQAGNVKP